MATRAGFRGSQGGTYPPPIPVSSTPAYISALSPYQALALDSSFAPASGRTTLNDATPAQWISAGDQHQAAIFYAWSGAAKNIAGSKLPIFGGGHQDGGNNGVYTYDFDGGAKPNGFAAMVYGTDVSLTTDMQNGEAYLDGKCSAHHTYDGLVYVASGDKMYLFGGVPRAGGGGGTTYATWRYVLSTKTWTRLNDFPVTNSSGGIGANTFYDPTTSKIYVLPALRNAGSVTGVFFRFSDDDWHGQVGTGLDDVPESCGAWDYTRGKALLPQNFEAGALDPTCLLTINFSAESLSATTISWTGDTEIFASSDISKVSCFFDPVCDCYWFFGGQRDSTGYASIYSTPAGSVGSTWTITRHALSLEIPRLGSPTSSAYFMRGSYGRYAFMSSWRAIGMVTSHDLPAYVVRLPSSL